MTKRCKATAWFMEVEFNCQLEEGHSGPHKQTGDIGLDISPIPYTFTWEGSYEELQQAMDAERDERRGR